MNTSSTTSRTRKGSALSFVSNHSSNNSSGSTRFSERSATTTTSRNTRKSSIHNISGGNLPSSPVDSKKSSSVYDEILKTAFKKKKLTPTTKTTTETTTSSTGTKPKTSLNTPTKRNLDKSRETSRTKISSTGSISKSTTASAASTKEQHDATSEQIPTRDTTDKINQTTINPQQESNTTAQEIPTRLDEESKLADDFPEKPIIDIPKLSALIETEKDLLNQTVVNNNTKSTIVPSTPSERIASLTDEEKTKVKNFAARNLKFNNPEDLFESPQQHRAILEDPNNVEGFIDERKDISVIQPIIEVKEILKQDVSTPRFINVEPSQLSIIEETPIVNKELETSIDSNSSYGSYMDSDDVVVFESPNKDETEIHNISPIQKDDEMEPIEMNESFTGTDKLEAHLQKTMNLEKENQLLEQEIKHLERELQSNHQSQEIQEIAHIIQPLHSVKLLNEDRPYFECESEPFQEEEAILTQQEQTDEVSKDELIQLRALPRNDVIHEEKKEVKNHVPVIKPIVIPEVFIRENSKPKKEINSSSSHVSQEEVKANDEHLQFEKELQKIVGEDFKRKKTNNTFMESQRGAASPLARLRRRVQNSIESKNEVIPSSDKPSTINHPSHEEPTTVTTQEDAKSMYRSQRLAGYKARRDARMKLLEKQEGAPLVSANNNEVVPPPSPIISTTISGRETMSKSIFDPHNNQVRNITPLAPTATSATQNQKRTTSAPVLNANSTPSKEVINNDDKPSSTVINEKRRISERNEETNAVEVVKTSRKRYDEVIIISPPRNPPPVVHHINPQSQNDQDPNIDVSVHEDGEKVSLLKKTEALLNMSRERHSPIRKIEITKETESPSVSFLNNSSSTINQLQNQSINHSMNQSINPLILNQLIVNKDDPRQETLNRVNHLEKFLKDLKKKKQDEQEGFEKKFDEMKNYFSQQLVTRDSEINDLTHQNKLLRDKLSIAQTQIDDLSIVIEHILETQEILEYQLKKPKVNRMTSPLRESNEEDEPVSPVSYPGNDLQNVHSPIAMNSAVIVSPPNKLSKKRFEEQQENNQQTPIAFSKEDINVDLSTDGEFYLSIGKSSLPLGEYVKTL